MEYTHQEESRLVNILVADDREENRKAARISIPNADVVGSATEAILYMNGAKKYDLIITDMKMEDKLSGLRVVEVALQKAILPYVLSNIGRGHNGDIVVMKPYGGEISLSGAKENPEVWKEALRRISNPPNKIGCRFGKIVEIFRARNQPVPMDQDLMMAIYYPHI